MYEYLRLRVCADQVSIRCVAALMCTCAHTCVRGCRCLCKCVCVCLCVCVCACALPAHFNLCHRARETPGCVCVRVCVCVADTRRAEPVCVCVCVCVADTRRAELVCVCVCVCVRACVLVSAHTGVVRLSPLQLTPSMSSVYPVWQPQRQLPTVLMHVWLHRCESSTHSFTSAN